MSENKINTTRLWNTDTIRLLNTLESQLKHHDWFYEYSDDSRYYNSGLREFTQIWQTIEKLQEIGENEFDRAIALYKQYKPVVSTPHEQVVTK